MRTMRMKTMRMRTMRKRTMREIERGEDVSTFGGLVHYEL